MIMMNRTIKTSLSLILVYVLMLGVFSTWGLTSAENMIDAEAEPTVSTTVSPTATMHENEITVSSTPYETGSKSTEKPKTTGVQYDPQPLSKEEVQGWIGMYNKALDRDGLSAALDTKPHWQYIVEEDIMPDGYYNQRVDNDEKFGAAYYTFFISPVKRAVVVSTATNRAGLQTSINNAGIGDIVSVRNNITFDNTPLTITKNITLQSEVSGSPVTLTQGTVNIRHIEVQPGYTLTLQNIVLDGKGTGGGIQLKTNTGLTAGGRLIMEKGTVIRSCANSNTTSGLNYSGGIHMESCASFTMNEGLIEKCSSKGNGGGVGLAGRAANSANDAKFIMNGGFIQNNKTDSDIYGGGGVSVNNGIFEMYGGEICNNESIGGGGILIQNAAPGQSTFTMTGGSIHDNTATSSTFGGGGMLMASGGEFTMKGGSIKNNHATANVGGGVRVTNNSKFTMDGAGAAITDNTAKINGGGVYVNSGSAFTLKSGLIGSNKAGTSGGGVYINNGTDGSTFSMTGGILTGNEAGYGGGICLDGGIFTLTGGEIGSSTNPNKATYGGGISVGNGTFTMTGASVSYNQTKDSGGGIFQSGGTSTMKAGFVNGNKVESTTQGGGGIAVTDGTFEMTGGEIYHNVSPLGGGVLVSDNAQGVGEFTMSGGTIHDNIQTNTAAFGGGGGVHVNFGEFTMKGGSIYKNSSERPGGGVRISSGGKFTMDGAAASITENTVDTDGGGVYINNGGILILKNGLISKNSAKNNGGGVSVNTSASENLFIMDGGTLTDNSANKDGGGVYMYGGSFTMNAGTVSYNRALTGNGGGVYVTDNAKVTSGMASGTCTITNNIADTGDGGGIYTTAYATDYVNLTVGRNSLFAKNTARYSCEPPVDDNNTFWQSINNLTNTLGVSGHPLNHLNPLTNYDINIPIRIVKYYVNSVLKPELTVTVADRSKITLPSYSGSQVDGWYKTPAANETKWSFDTDRVTSDMNLYALSRVHFSFYKIDADNPDQTLEGAVFHLYKWSGSGNPPDELVSKNSSGSGWALVNVYVSDTSGYVDIGDLDCDTVYQLVEINAPQGYQLPVGQWRIIADENGTIVFNTSMVDAKPLAFENTGTKEAPHYRLRNLKQYELPSTGGQNTIWTTVIGCLILAGCAVWLNFRRKSRKSYMEANRQSINEINNI